MQNFCKNLSKRHNTASTSMVFPKQRCSRKFASVLHFSSFIFEKECEILRKSLWKTNENFRIFFGKPNDSQRYPWNFFFLVNNMEDVVVVQAGKVFNSKSFFYNFLLRETTIENNQFLQIFLTLKFWKKIKIINHLASNRKMYLPLLVSVR